MNIVALICARGNSKGIKNKNLLEYKNTTLLGQAIKQSLKSKLINRVIISTDSKKIAKEAEKYNVEIPFLRPANLAKDNSPELLVWRHAVKYLEKEKKKIDYIVSVPTTSPLRDVSDINKAILLARKKKLDIVFSITKSSKNPYFNMVTIKKNKLQLIQKNKNRIFRRQDAPKCYDLTTVCYVFKPKYILKTNDLFKGKTGFVTIPKERSLDIDDKFDYQIAKILG